MKVNTDTNEGAKRPLWQVNPVIGSGLYIHDYTHLHACNTESKCWHGPISQFDISVLTHRLSSLDCGNLAFLNRQHLLYAATMPAGLADVASPIHLWMDENMPLGEIRCTPMLPASHWLADTVQPRIQYAGIHPVCYQYVGCVQFPLASWKLTDLWTLKSRVINIHDIISLAPYLFVEPDYTSELAKSMIKRATPEQHCMCNSPSFVRGIHLLRTASQLGDDRILSNLFKSSWLCYDHGSLDLYIVPKYSSKQGFLPFTCTLSMKSIHLPLRHTGLPRVNWVIGLMHLNIIAFVFFPEEILSTVHAVLERTPDDSWDAGMLHDLLTKEKKQRHNLFLSVVRHALTVMKVRSFLRPPHCGGRCIFGTQSQGPNMSAISLVFNAKLKRIIFFSWFSPS